MQHAEFFASRPTPGLEKPTCPGGLVRLWTRSDPVAGGAEHSIELYECDSCRARVSFDATAGRVLNVYHPPEVSVMAADLARAFDASKAGV